MAHPFKWNDTTRLKETNSIVAFMVKGGLILQQPDGRTVAYLRRGDQTPFSDGQLTWAADSNHLSFYPPSTRSHPPSAYRARLRCDKTYRVTPRNVATLTATELVKHRLGALFTELGSSAVEITVSVPVDLGGVLRRLSSNDACLEQDVVVTDSPREMWEWTRSASTAEKLDFITFSSVSSLGPTPSFIALGRWTLKQGLQWHRAHGFQSRLDIENVVRPLLASAMCQIPDVREDQQ